ncbi:hypothetical protein D3C72_2246980 [compost metagenome]
MRAATAIGAVAVTTAVAAACAHLAAALVGTGHKVFGHALGIGQVGHGDLGRRAGLLRLGARAPGHGGGGDHGQGRVQGSSALHGVLLVS